MSSVENELSGLADPEAIMMLTSAGPTTDTLKDAALDTFGGLAHRLRIVRLSDGWQPFRGSDGAPVDKRIEHRGEAVAAKIWSKAYLKHVFGKNVQIKTVQAGRLAGDAFADLVTNADLLTVPGGNTFLVARGLKNHADFIKDAKPPLLTESAGSINVGASLDPANIEPADFQPEDFSITTGLGLVHANVVVHVPGRTQGFDVPIWSRLSDGMLRKYETPQNVLDEYVSASLESLITLHDGQAAVFSGGNAQYVE